MNGKEFAATPDQLKAGNPKYSVWVSANAGAGKTHVLVERVMRLLLSGAEPASILCITYTKAAAAEMWSRLFERLSEWTNLDDAALTKSLQRLDEDGADAALRKRARQLFTRALETPGGLKIQTIHAFCERLLHLFPLEAGLAPGFSVMDERRELELQNQATAFVLNRAEREIESPQAKASRTLTEKLNEEQFQFLISDFVRAMRKAGPELLAVSSESYEMALASGLGVSHLRLEEIERELGTIDKAAYLHHAELLEPSGSHNKVNPSEKMRKIARSNEPALLLEELYLTDGGKERSSLIGVKTAAALPATSDFIAAEKTRVFDLIRKRNTLLIIAESTNAFRLAKEILQKISTEKQRLGLYDFTDLIARAALLLSNAKATQWVLHKLDQGLSHILVDEAQDTSPDQWRIVRRLADEFFSGAGRPQRALRSLFVVGDQKQSIFSFQGADAKGFTRTQEELSLQSQDLMQTVELTTSYRSTDEVLTAVDKVFPGPKLKLMGITGATERGHTAVRKQQGIVELWPFEEEDKTPEPDTWERPVDRPPETSAERKLAKKIATTIASWLSKNRPRELVAQNRAVEPGDILILFQTRSPLYRMVLAELRKEDVPVAGADRLKLLDSMIVQDLLSLLGWMLLPQDDHALAVILKSPLVPEPVTEKQLFELCHDRKASLAELIKGPNADYLKMLQGKARQNSPFQILSSILTKSRLAIARRLGAEALEASAAILDLAVDYEVEHGISLFGFLQWFSATQTTLKRDMDKAKGDVRLMTVHGAKGLEAKIVIIADATFVKRPFDNRPSVISVPEGERAAGLPVWKISGAEPVAQAFQVWVDHHKQELENERDRLLYVAMTRAADEIYICGAKGKNKVGDKAWWTQITQSLGEPKDDQPLRFGPEDIYGAQKSTPKSDVMKSYPWLWAIPTPEPQAKPKPSAPSGKGKAFDDQAAQRGSVLHRLLQDIGDVPLERRFSVARQRAIALGLQESDALQTVDLLSREDLAPYFSTGSQSEVDIIGTLPSGDEISGRIDRICVGADHIWLLDFKTNASGGEPMSPKHAYVQQLAQYHALLHQAYPTKLITAALLWTQSGKLETLPEPMITAALQEIEQPVT